MSDSNYSRGSMGRDPDPSSSVPYKDAEWYRGFYEGSSPKQTSSSWPTSSSSWNPTPASSSPPSYSSPQASPSYNTWGSSGSRNSGSSLSIEEAGQAAAGIAALVAVVAVVAAVLWVLAMIYMFRLEILTSLAGIGLAYAVGHTVNDILIDRFRNWIPPAATTLAVLMLLLLTGFEVRNLLIFHNWNGLDLSIGHDWSGKDFDLPTGMLGTWGMSLLTLLLVSAAEVGIALYVVARREAQWIVASLVLLAWGAASVFSVASWIVGLPNNTLAWCAGALWGWVAVGFLLVPLSESAPGMAEMVRNFSCALTGLPWLLVLIRYLLPELERSGLGMMQTAATILWVWFGAFAVAWPLRKLAPVVWETTIIVCRALPIALWIECSNHVLWPELKALDYSTPGLVGAALWVCVGLGLIAVPLWPISDSRRKTFFLFGYSQIPALLMTCLFRNLPPWISAVRTAPLNPWLLSVEVLGWIALITATAGSITFLIWVLNVRATWRVAVAEVWMLRALAALSWLYIFVQYFPPWIVAPRGVWMWIGGSLGWVIWLAALLSMAKISALMMNWSDSRLSGFCAKGKA